jgi:hypothetical protein
VRFTVAVEEVPALTVPMQAVLTQTVAAAVAAAVALSTKGKEFCPAVLAVLALCGLWSLTKTNFVLNFVKQ